MSPCNGLKLRYIFIIELYFILISIKSISCQEFIDLKKLSSSDTYFVILDIGLFLYDFNTFNSTLIHEFNENEYRGAKKIILTELYSKFKAYIFCSVNEHLFLYNEYTYKLLYYKINEIINFNLSNADYYNILPYKIENNNISFIIAYNNDTTNLFFYFYNLNINELALKEPKIIQFNDMNIQNKMIKCEINYFSTFIICFYHSKDNSQNLFQNTIFIINDMNLSIKQTSEIPFDRTLNEINQIKLAKSFNDKFFICILNKDIPSCFINENSLEFKEMDCIYPDKDPWSINIKFFILMKLMNSCIYQEVG